MAVLRFLHMSLLSWYTYIGLICREDKIICQLKQN
nr:MAG TPA: hypothetical protein [Caudoviricetes sp.]